MADLSDVDALLAQMATAAVYPNGTANPSVTGDPVRIMEGWPNSAQLDADMAASPPVAQVSVFPLNSGSATISTQLFEEPIVVTPAVHGVSALVTGTSVALSGTPGPNEYVTIIADNRHAYSRVGSTLAAIVTALLADIKADYPDASASGTTITIPNTTALVCRIGATAIMGHLIHRQKQQVAITVWASTPATRTILAQAIDVYLKQHLRVSFPDQSQGILTFDRTTMSDEFEKLRIYRRDLVYSLEYGTLETFPAFEVTSVGVTTDDGGGATITAVT